MKDRWARILAPVLLLLFLVGTWEVLVRWFHVQPFILPAPSQILIAFGDNFALLSWHGAITLSEILLGLLLGGLGGFLLAIAVFYSPLLDKALYPLIIGSQMIPVFAIAPILIVWMGYGLWPKVTVAALISFFPLVVNVSDGLREPSEPAVDLFRSMGATRSQIFWKLRLPASMPTLFSGLKVSATLAVVGATIGEWVGSRRGLGYLMLQSNARLRMNLVFAAILMLSILGLLLFGVLRIIERRVVHWRAAKADAGEV
ncbi:ABC transporter permease [Candidatus Bipolaricaulota bacterium]|nr:ABC transporter permease [Candidatus Bipolaricaulota bacterium]